MSNHTPTIADTLVTCDRCPFRAVLTTDSRVLITEVGDPSVDHLAAVRAQQAARRAYAEQLVTRLDGLDMCASLKPQMRRYIRREHGL